MLSNRIRRLAPPPRPVPLPIICAAMLGTTGGFGALFMIMGLVFSIIFTRGYRPLEDVRLALSHDTAEGRVTRVVESNATENDVTVYEYVYSFTTRREEKMTGRSFSTGRRWSNGSSVPVEYVPDAPYISRIEGARTSMFSPWVLFVLIFPAVGGALFLSAAIGGLRQVILLRHGKVADARITSTRPTNTTVNGVPILEYAYEIQTSMGAVADGKAKAFPSDRLGDEETEPALYLPSNPDRSTLVDAISVSYPLDVDGLSGQWITGEGKQKTMLYILAWVAALLLGGYWILSLLGIIR
ncbi:MAG: DUF3592 domain-containing protein [Anaerolineales bacterium]|nr:DUF3592 domain-containing protein [Anaerolineales bacterium]